MWILRNLLSPASTLATNDDLIKIWGQAIMIATLAMVERGGFIECRQADQRPVSLDVLSEDVNTLYPYPEDFQFVDTDRVPILTLETGLQLYAERA